MNFEFSSEQRQLQDEVRRLLAERCDSAAVRRVIDAGASHDAALWRTLGELGFLGAALPEQYGGSGATALELCVIAEELGRALAPVPFTAGIGLFAPLLLACGTEAQKQAWLPRLAAGEIVATVAMTEGAGQPDTRPAARCTNNRLTGSKLPVPDGLSAAVALVTVQGSDACTGLALVDLQAPGVTRTPLNALDPTRPLARLDFIDTPCTLLCDDAAAALNAALDHAAVLTAFEQIGSAEAALAMARQYALDRYAFGRPIGSFQAIKHKLVDMWVGLVLARSNATYGAWAVAGAQPQCPEAAATARVSATQAHQYCVRENIQVHGGMGFTWDLDCQLHYRRAHALAVQLGGLTWWQDRMIEALKTRRDAALPA